MVAFQKTEIKRQDIKVHRYSRVIATPMLYIPCTNVLHKGCIDSINTIVVASL